MESVTPYALIMQPAGYGVMIGQLVMVASKASYTEATVWWDRVKANLGRI